MHALILRLLLPWLLLPQIAVDAASSGLPAAEAYAAAEAGDGPHGQKAVRGSQVGALPGERRQHASAAPAQALAVLEAGGMLPGAGC